MNPLYIEGTGITGAFGTGLENYRGALKTYLSTGVTPKVDTETSYFPCYRADTTPLANYVNKRLLRRMDHFTKLALLGACNALENAGMAESDKTHMGLIIATGYGATQTTFDFLDSVINDGDALCSPTRFSSSLHNVAASNIALTLGIRGPCASVSQFEQSFFEALQLAHCWLEEDRCESVLLGAVDEVCEVARYVCSRYFGQTSPTDHEPPNSQIRLIPGEGSVGFILKKNSTKNVPHITQLAFGPNVFFSDKPESKRILSSNGFNHSQHLLNERLKGFSATTCLQPIYGCLPVGMGFDLAAAMALIDQTPASTEILCVDAHGAICRIDLNQ
jgi:3-oxoacyl-[acyl-carrier-protein] synthase II